MSTPSPATKSKLEGNARLLKTGEHADFIISCGDVVFRVHRSIVCPRSEPIKQLIDGKAVYNDIATIQKANKEAVRTTADETEANVKVEEHTESSLKKRTRQADDNLPIIQLYDDPEHVERILQWIYTDDYNDNPQIVDAHATRSAASIVASQSSRALVINVRILILGNQYKLDGLQQLAEEKYVKALEVEGLTDSLPESMMLLFQTSFPSDRVTKVNAINFATLKFPLLVKQARFKAMLQNNGKMAFAILRAIAPQSPVECPKCESNQDIASRQFTLLKVPGKRIHNHFCFGCKYKF